MKYEDIGIFELRLIAREVGVKSASTLKKAELIKKIQQIKSGELEPYIKKTKQGRPAKKLLIKLL